MRKLIVIAHISVDGFVAGPNGEFDHFVGGDENLEFVCRITDDADAALFGRKSYELLNQYWPTAAGKPGANKDEIHYSNWYNRVPKFVLSATLQDNAGGNTFVINQNSKEKIERLKQSDEYGTKNILIFGSPTTAHSLLELNLIDGFWLIIHPVLFGKGIPLFSNRDVVNKLTPEVNRQLPNGVICIYYAIK
jgi:dihydrofolate reductase